MPIFNALPALYLLLSPELKIVAATDAYLQATLTERQKLLGNSIFDAFPDNPRTPEAKSVHNLRTSLHKVLETRETHEMAVQRYDVPNPNNSGEYVYRYWLPRNTPVLDKQGQVQYIIHEVFNVSDRVREGSLTIDHTPEQIELIEPQQLELRTLNTQLKQMNQALRESVRVAEEAQKRAIRERNLLEALLEQAPVAIGLFQGPDCVVAKANTLLCASLGYPQQHILGKPLLEAVPELQGQGFKEILIEVERTGVPYIGKEVPAKLLQPNGKVSTRYFNFVYQPLYDDAGKIIGVLDIAIDVTDQVETRLQMQQLNEELENRVAERTREARKAKADAERQKQRLESLFMKAPAAICILNGPDLVYELVNPTYQQLFPERQLLGKPILEALPEIENNEVYRTFRKVYATGNTHEEQEMLIPFRRSDGVWEDRYFRYIQQARHNEHGEVDGILVFAFEVTNQVQSRKASEASAQKLRLITDSLPALIGYVNREERYEFANKAYERWFNMPVQQLLGRTMREVVGDKAYQVAEANIARVLKGERMDYEATMPYRENFVRHTHTSFVPDLQQGQVQGFYVLVHDFTQQIEAQNAVRESEQQAKKLAANLASANKELHSTNERLQRINSDLDNFIYTASHDLKAPILNIEGLMTTLLHELPEQVLQKPAVQQINSLISGSVNRFKRTIENLTDITKLQKATETEASRVDVAAVLEGVQLDLANMVAEYNASIEVDLSECHTINFSEKNLRSIIYNLLSNALKYSAPERKPLIRVRCHETARYSLLTVEDNGLGIDAAQQRKLFSMFQRLHSHVEGTGIGLYMVKRIVENAGGKIEVQSEVGKGSTFKVYFPLQCI